MSNGWLIEEWGYDTVLVPAFQRCFFGSIPYHTQFDLTFVYIHCQWLFITESGLRLSESFTRMRSAYIATRLWSQSRFGIFLTYSLSTLCTGCRSKDDGGCCVACWYMMPSVDLNIAVCV